MHKKPGEGVFLDLGGAGSGRYRIGISFFSFSPPEMAQPLSIEWVACAMGGLQTDQSIDQPTDQPTGHPTDQPPVCAQRLLFGGMWACSRCQLRRGPL